MLPTCAALLNSTCQDRLSFGSQLISAVRTPPPTPVNQWPSANPAGVQKMNAARQLRHAPPLQWNVTLSTLASQIAMNCEPTNISSLYASSVCTGQYTWTDCVGLWFSESLEYDADVPNVSPANKDFINLVWHSTTQVGCGQEACSGVTGFVGVCLFGPLYSGLPTQASLSANVRRA